MTSHKSWANPATENRSLAMCDVMFRSHAQAVFAVCLANTRNHHDAEDVMQAVFLKALVKASTVREPARIRAWLLQVARRMCVDFHRRRPPTEMLLEEPAAPHSSGNVLSEHLHTAIQKLPLNYRETIVLYYLDGRDCSSVAATLDTTETAVRQRLVRARAMLHGLLQGDKP